MNWSRIYSLFLGNIYFFHDFFAFWTILVNFRKKLLKTRTDNFRWRSTNLHVWTHRLPSPEKIHDVTENYTPCNLVFNSWKLHVTVADQLTRVQPTWSCTQNCCRCRHGLAPVPSTSSLTRLCLNPLQARFLDDNFNQLQPIGTYMVTSKALRCMCPNSKCQPHFKFENETTL